MGRVLGCVGGCVVWSGGVVRWFGGSVLGVASGVVLVVGWSGWLGWVMGLGVVKKQKTKTKTLKKTN